MDVAGFCIPDGIEPIIGWRYWQSDGEWLCSLHRFKTWPAGQALQARCPYPDTHAGPSPDQACGCGLYAAPDLETLLELTNSELDSRRQRSRWTRWLTEPSAPTRTPGLPAPTAHRVGSRLPHIRRARPRRGGQDLVKPMSS